MPDSYLQGVTGDGFYHVGLTDLSILSMGWQILESSTGPYPGGPGIAGQVVGSKLAACADYDHLPQGTTGTGYYRCGLADLAILAVNWQILESSIGPSYPGGPGLELCSPGNVTSP